jgi:hypothetical protein
MMRMALAFRAFFAVLFNKDAAHRVRQALLGKDLVLAKDAISAKGTASSSKQELPHNEERPANPTIASPARSDALTLLMVLQRDSRILDLLNESLDQYSDEQIGGAARPVLQNAGKSLERLFGLKHLATQSEGEQIEVPDNGSPVRWRLIGNTSAKVGRIAHPGWLATKVDLPKWTGQRDDAMVLAPIEVEPGS